MFVICDLVTISVPAKCYFLLGIPLSLLVLLPYSLKLRQESWEARLRSLPSIETVMANCILAAAFTTCCGSLKTESRLRVFNSLLAICKRCGFPPAGSEDRENLLTMEQYPVFMIGEVTIMGMVACIGMLCKAVHVNRSIFVNRHRGSVFCTVNCLSCDLVYI